MNIKDNWLTTATINDEPRRALWSTVFPDAVVPIKSIFTYKLSIPEHHHDVNCFMLDLDALNEKQISGVVAVLSLRIGIDEDEVRKELHQGVPIVADGVTVTSKDFGLLMSMVDDDDQLLAFSDQLDTEEDYL